MGLWINTIDMIMLLIALVVIFIAMRIGKETVSFANGSMQSDITTDNQGTTSL